MTGGAAGPGGGGLPATVRFSRALRSGFFFSSAIGAYGGFFIPKAYGTSIALTGSPGAALWAFLGFYLVCLVLTWAVYTRRGGLLHDIERAGRLAQPAE